MILYFLRHGDAGHGAGALDDDARELTVAGIEALRAGAPLWSRLNLRPSVVVSSPLPRARQTAEAFLEAMGAPGALVIDSRLRPGASWADFAQAMANHPDAGRVMFVGHEPDLSRAIALLTGATQVRMRKGALACVEFPGVPGPGAGELAWLLDPDLYADAGDGADTLRVAAYAVVVDDADRLLLCRLSVGEVKPGWWTLPGGGLDFGEDPRDAVLRELTEETGLTGEVVSLATVESYARPRSTHKGGPTARFQTIQIVYRVRLTGGSLRSEVDGSTDAAAWCTRVDLEKLPLVGLARVGARLAFG